MADPLATVHRADGTIEVVVPPRAEAWGDARGTIELFWLRPQDRPSLGPGDRMEIVWPDGRTTNHFPAEAPYHVPQAAPVDGGHSAPPWPGDVPW